MSSERLQLCLIYLYIWIELYAPVRLDSQEWHLHGYNSIFFFFFACSDLIFTDCLGYETGEMEYT